MMTLCNANPIIEYDRRRSGLPSAPLDMTTVYSNSPHHVRTPLSAGSGLGRRYLAADRNERRRPRVYWRDSCLGRPLRTYG